MKSRFIERCYLIESQAKISKEVARALIFDLEDMVEHIEQPPYLPIVKEVAKVKITNRRTSKPRKAKSKTMARIRLGYSVRYMQTETFCCELKG